MNMKNITISGVKNEYRSGDTVSCNVNIIRLFDKDEINSVDVSLIKRKTMRVKTGIKTFIHSPVYNTTGRLTSSGYWVNQYKTKTIDKVLGNDFTDSVPIRYNKDHKFKIPEYESNSSSCGCHPLVQEDDTEYFQQFISFCISTKIKYVNNKGIEKEKIQYKTFVNKKIIEASMPRYFHMFSETYSLMYMSNTSEFSPGENVNLKIVLINKENNKKILLHSLITDLYSSDFKIKKSKYFKSLKKKSLSKEKEYGYMKKEIDSGNCTTFRFKLPNNMYGENDRSISVAFKLDDVFDAQDVVKTGPELYQIQNLAYDVLHGEDFELELGKENESEEKDEEKEENLNVPILESKDIPIYYRSLLKINGVRKSIGNIFK